MGKPVHEQALRRDRDNLRKHLRDLVNVVERAVERIDAEMRKPSSPERGQAVAGITNALDLQKDLARRFGLGDAPKKRGKQ